MDEFLIPVFIIFSLLVPVTALALLFFAVPVRAAITLVWHGDRHEQAVVVSWGIAAIRSSGKGSDRKTEVLIANRTVHSGNVTESKKSVPDRTPAPPSALNIDEVVQIIQKIIGPVGAFGSVFWNESRFEDARGAVTLGLSDPALTGEICGYYWASRFILHASRVYIELEPVFDRQVFGMDITVRVKVRHPLLVMIAGLELARNPAVKAAMHRVMGKSRGVAVA